ncbi:hypothetical protein HDU67_001604 [Dinochytrium kinnereticum]|nr:hypothetical protein HDU67_001604 [Dinochytrium kinnereticum]
MDKRLSIYFESQQIYEDVMILLRFNCPDASCDVACPEGWSELRRHVQAAHGKYLCDLCTRHQKLFTHEHALYTATELDRHFKLGDENDKSFKGHPSCGFCKTHFYGDDELYEHCRKDHEQCFLCTRAGVRHQYYLNYNSLEAHFRADHFACLEPSCLEKKFQVFATDIDFKAHEMEAHPHKRTRGAKGERIEVNFQVAGGPSNGGRRRQPDSRDQRQSSASSLSSHSGDPPLRPAEDRSSRKEPESNAAATSSISARVPIYQNHTGSPNLRERKLDRTSVLDEQNFPPPESTSREPPKPLKPPPAEEGDVVAKLQILFDSSESKFTEFKSLATSFRQNVLSAQEFFDGFLSLAMLDARTNLDKKSSELMAFGIWTKMADTVPDEAQNAKAKWNPNNARQKGKRELMLEALNNYRAKKSHISNNPTPAASSYARPTTKDAPLPRSSAQDSSASSARVLVIKSKASKQKIHAGANMVSWSGASEGRGFIASFEGASSSSTPAATVAPILSIVKQPVGKPIGTKNDFPGLPKPAVNRLERAKKETASVWSEASGSSQDDVASEQQKNQKKSKKGKEVLLHFG